MSIDKAESLPIAVRVYPQLNNSKRQIRSHKPWKRPDARLILDTESRTDAPQRLTFGSYRFVVNGRCLEEGLFYGNDLPDKDRQILEHYVATHRADTVKVGKANLLLLTRADFVKKLFRAAYKGRCLVVAFNFSFDTSRIACDFVPARGDFAGGFSLGLWSYADKTGRQKTDPNRPRVRIKHIDSKRALKDFTGRENADRAELIPEGSKTGKPEKGYKFRGNFLDVRTLAFALTDKGYTLEALCEDFHVEHGKQHPSAHGIVSEEYIDYNRRDVLATHEVTIKLLEEFDKHPISLAPTKAYSPASIGKAYLREMGIEPVLQRQPNFPKRYLGYAQSAFSGGRTSAHIRKVAVPVVYTDFLSMYPTINSNMGLWRFVIAREIKVIPHCQKEIRAFLGRINADTLFNPQAWKQMTAFVKVIPDGDILPSRAKYSRANNSWQVGVNYLHPGSNEPNQELWFSLPDIVASVLLTGRVPKIVDAFRIEPHGILPNLKRIKLRGTIEVDPAREDFFRVVIEQRKSLAANPNLSEIERKRLDKALKVLANATSYGIYAEMIRQDADRSVKVTCHGIDALPYSCNVAHPDSPGEYCFPPLASLITGAARLMLALLEHCVTEAGGTYAMEDTDSMAIVATEHGGLVACPGGPERTADGREAIRALSWKRVRDVSERFAALNPYNREVIPGSILKIEKDNFDPKTGKQRQLYCFAISAKRYALFLRDDNGNPALLREDVNNKEDRWSEHGLGHLLNPVDPESDDREWIAQAWLRIIRRALGLPVKELDFEHVPAVSQTTISSPAVMRPFEDFNRRKRFADQMKPFNFISTCHVNPLGHPVGSDPERFHLIAPYEKDPRKWEALDWIDQYAGKPYRITTVGDHGSRDTARVKTYDNVLDAYEFHPESKCADKDGNPCGKQAVGLLQRRHIRIGEIKCIGKESNSLEDVESGLIHSEKSAYTQYPDPRRDEWQTKILPALRKVSLNLLVKKCRGRLSRRAIINLKAGRSRPHRSNRELLATILRNT